MQFQYPVTYWTYVKWWMTIAKWIILILPPCAMALNRNTLDEGSVILNYIALYITCLLISFVVVIITGLGFTTSCIARFRQHGKMLRISVDESGIYEETDENRVGIQWHEVKHVSYGKNYIRIVDDKIMIITCQSDIGFVNFRNLKNYVQRCVNLATVKKTNSM